MEADENDANFLLSSNGLLKMPSYHKFIRNGLQLQHKKECIQVFSIREFLLV